MIPIDPLTPREVEILRFMAQGKKDSEIAEALCIANKTVRSHSNNIFTKLYVRSRTEAVVKAQWLGLVQSPGALSVEAQMIWRIEQMRPGSVRELIDAGIVPAGR